MKFININRTDEECLNSALRNTTTKKEIKVIKALPISELRYIDNQYRIYDARKNWKRIIEKTARQQRQQKTKVKIS